MDVTWSVALAAEANISAVTAGSSKTNSSPPINLGESNVAGNASRSTQNRDKLTDADYSRKVGKCPLICLSTILRRR
jgi:hypothetical protein